MAAERLGDGSDEANFTGRAVDKTVFASGLAALVRNLLERPTRVDALMNLRGGDDEAARPVAVGIQRHEIDEEPDDAPLPGGKGGNFLIVLVVGAGPGRGFIWARPAGVLLG